MELNPLPTTPIKLNLPSFTYLAYFKISYNLQSGNPQMRKRISFRSEEQLQTRKTLKHSNKIFPKFIKKIDPEKNRMSSFCISFLQKSETQFFTIVFSVRFQKRFPALNDLIGLFTYCMKQKYIYKNLLFAKMRLNNAKIFVQSVLSFFCGSSNTIKRNL